MPSFAWTVWPDVDFEWYANVGKPAAGSVEVYPAPRAGYTSRTRDAPVSRRTRAELMAK